MQAEALKRKTGRYDVRKKTGARLHCKPALTFFLSVTTALVSGLAIYPLSAHAQTEALSSGSERISFNIPAQSLNRALVAFSNATGDQMFFDASIVGGKSAPAIQGTMTRNEAIERLLSGSGLNYRISGNTVTITDRVSSAQAPVDADGATVLGVIDVTSSSGGVFSPDTPYETAGSSTYISGEKIERFRGTSVGDMLSGTPGVLNADNRNGAALDVNIRGMQGQGRVPVSVDGAIQETTVWRGYSGVAGRSYVDPDFIGEVMVEKGPSSAADGAGAIGGVVRMNTISVDDILLPDRNFGVRLKGGFNSNSSSVPPIDTTGGLTGAGNYPNNSVPTSFGGPDGMDRPAFLEPTGGNGSIAAGYRSEYVDLVGAYARRKNGNYHAGTNGSGVPQPIITPRQIWENGQYVDSPTESTVKFEGLNRFRAGEEVLNTSQDNASVLLKGTFRLPYDQQLDLSYMRYESKYGEIMPSQIIWSENYGSYQAVLNEVKMDTYTAKYKWDPVDNDLFDFKVGLWMTDAELTIPYQWYGVGGNDPMMPNYYGTDNRRWGFNLQNTSAFDTAMGVASLSYGGSYTYETIRPGEDAWEGGRTGNRREVSLFTSGEWKPNDWLTLNASLRYTDYKSEDTNSWTVYPIQHGDQVINFKSSAERTAYRLANPGSVNLPTTTANGVFATYEGDGFAPMVSATVEPWDGIQFYGKYAEAIRLPSLFETTRGFSTDYSGIALDPEHAKMWEFGMNVLRDDMFVADDKLRLKASYFDNKVDDYLTRTNLIGSAGRASIINIDKAHLRGIELSTSYDTGRFFGDLAYTRYLHTEFCNKPGMNIGNPIVNGERTSDLCFEGGTVNSYVVNQIPPRDSLSLTLGARAFEEKLTVGGRLTYIGKRPTAQTGGTIVHFDWKPYTLVDLFASYKVNEQFQIDAAIDNVTDVYYMDTLTLGLMPSPGRTFRLNMTAKF